jgi:hypothetical protein
MTSSTSRTTVELIETVVVDPADIVEAFERNRRDESERRDHVLRVSAPLEDEVRATLSVSDDRSSTPSDGTPLPIDLAPEAFVHVHGDYDRDRTRVSVPTRRESRSIARSDRGDDVDEETVEEYHATAMDAWEQCVRTTLVDEVPLATDSDEAWTEVRYDGESESDE